MIGSSPPSHQRFPAILLLALLAAACGGGGGGGNTPDAPPVLISASFVGAGGSPVVGDTLVLTFSENVTAVAGKLLTDADVTLSGGASLGAVAAAPTQPAANTLTIVFGAGVSVVGDSTTIVLAADNDVVIDGGGKLGTGGTPVVIGSSDGAAPVIANFTLAAIDAELNGTGAAGGTLQVPTNGWTIDLSYTDNSAIATAQTSITASVSVNTSSGAQPPGTNLVPFLTTVSATNTTASYRVPSTVTFPNGALTLTAVIADVSGLASSPATFAANVRAFTDPLRPFETNVNTSQVWYLDFSRDIESFTTSGSGTGVRVDIVAGANGRSDFEDILRIVGLNSATPIANVQGSLDSNAVVNARFQDELVQQLEALYDGANVSFTLTQPSGSFGSNASVTYSSFGYSQIAIAGSSDLNGVLGIAIFDPNNTTQDDDTRTDYSGTRLGVFLHTIADAGLGSGASSSFRLVFDTFAAVHGGVPIGEDNADDDRLNGTNTDARADDIAAAIAALARFTAVVTGHECGHSVGLVMNGAMPTGLYGDDTTNFPGSSDGHISNQSLFSGGAINVMSPQLSFSSATNAGTHFNSLNLAYLREQVFYGN